MKKPLNLFYLFIGLTLFAAGCGTNAEDSAEQQSSQSDKNESAETDDDERIISTTVALTEIMEELDVDLAGVPTTSEDLPERYEDTKEVGMAMDPDLEIIKSLKPTDVLSVTTLTSFVGDSFENADIPATFVDLESVEGMYDAIYDLGKEFDRTDEAEELINNYEDKFSEIEESIKGKDNPTVLILLGVPGSYLVATENSYVGDLVERAGGENAIDKDGDKEYIQSNTENLQQSDPDVILRMAHGMPEEVQKMFDEEFEENDIWKHFKAVKNDRVYDLEEPVFATTANLHATEALEKLADILYPDRSE